MVKAVLRTNIMLKFFSLLFGFTFWFIWGANQVTTRAVEVPICFYNDTGAYDIAAPEKISMVLSGKRNDLVRIDVAQLAMHIDASTLAMGEQLLMPTSEQLFLPSTIKLLHWHLNNPIITVREKIA